MHALQFKMTIDSNVLCNLLAKKKLDQLYLNVFITIIPIKMGKRQITWPNKPITKRIMNNSFLHAAVFMNHGSHAPLMSRVKVWRKDAPKMFVHRKWTIWFCMNFSCEFSHTHMTHEQLIIERTSLYPSPRNEKLHLSNYLHRPSNFWICWRKNRCNWFNIAADRQTQPAMLHKSIRFHSIFNDDVNWS